MRHLDLALLRSFVAVVEAGSVTRAAARVHLTQAAVSQQIRRLEGALGQELFVRRGKRLFLSHAGERLLAQARRMLALNDEVWTAMLAPEKDGEVRLGVPHDLTDSLLPPVLKGFKQDWPGVRASVISANSVDIIDLYRRGEVDLCLTTELGCQPPGEVLYPDLLIWSGAPGGDAWLREPLPVMLGGPRCAFRQPLIEAVGAAGRDWRIAGETSDIASLRACVLGDLAVTALLLSTVPSSLVPIPADAGLPPLPAFNVNLYPPPPGSARPAVELARHIRMALGAGERLRAMRPAAA